VNRGVGYLGGDRVLEEFGRRLTAVARSQDLTFEVNGSTFVLLIRNPINEGHAVLAAERLVQEAEAPVCLGPLRARVRAHMGIALAPRPAGTAEELLRQAERALAEARSRDDSYLVFGSHMEGRRSGPGGQPLDLEEALKRSELELFFQPKMNLRNGALVGAEALVRWRLADGRVVPPDEFLPAIEATRGIRSLLWFVLNAALRNAAGWLAAIPDFKIAVNVSPANLEDPDLADIVAEALGVWGLPANQLLLEITETAIMRGHADLEVALARLHGLGVGLAIDDFGTGYSSLAHLRSIPARELKIDKSFVMPVMSDRRDREIVAAVIRLGHALNLEVVAEGIESSEVVQALLAMGCDLGQGYHFSPAIPAEQFAVDWVSRYARRNAVTAPPRAG
jgi:predicted signal transduction protein with EAL and GGDEF domain